MTRLLTVPEAAVRMHISQKTTWKMVYARKVAVVRIGRCVRIKGDSIDKLIEDRTIPADEADDE